MVKQRQIIVHSDYANGDTEGPYRDGRVDDTLVSPNTVRVYDGVLADGYLELSHDGAQAKIESSLGVVEVDGVVVVAHERRHLVDGEDSIYVRASRAPTIDDDGYGVGKRWLNLSSDGYEYVCIQDNSGDAIWRTSVAGGGGLSELEHEALDTLVHEIDETSYDEVTYVGHNVSSYIVWETSAKLKKIREELYSYALDNKVSQVIAKQYDVTGVLKMTVTESYTYSGNKILSITRTKN
jgi:hypothetical protein